MRTFVSLSLTAALLLLSGLALAEQKPEEKNPPVEVLSHKLQDGKLYANLYTTATDWPGLHRALMAQKDHLLAQFGSGKVAILKVYNDKTKAPDLEKVDPAAATPDAALAVLVAGYDNDLVGEWRFCFGGTRTDEGRVGDFKKCVYDADKPEGDAYKVE